MNAPSRTPCASKQMKGAFTEHAFPAEVTSGLTLFFCFLFCFLMCFQCGGKPQMPLLYQHFFYYIFCLFVCFWSQMQCSWLTPCSTLRDYSLQVQETKWHAGDPTWVICVQADILFAVLWFWPHPLCIVFEAFFFFRVTPSDA